VDATEKTRQQNNTAWQDAINTGSSEPGRSKPHQLSGKKTTPDGDGRTFDVIAQDRMRMAA
jgi:hypothetical protein